MALKFCAGIFSTEAPTSSSSAAAHVRSAPVTPSSKRQLLLQHATRTIVLDAQDGKWTKEFRVHFDGSKPTGLGFETAARSVRGAPRRSFSPAASPRRASLAGNTNSSSTSIVLPHDESERYACAVREVVPEGLAAEYNARCRSIGDYSCIVTKGLRVRKVNDTDVADVAYDDVLQLMRDAMPTFFLTFADTTSKRTTPALMTTATAALRLAQASSKHPHTNTTSNSSASPTQTIAAVAAALAASQAPFARRNTNLGLSPAATRSGILDAQNVLHRIARRNSSSSIVQLRGGGGNSSVDEDDHATQDAARVSALEVTVNDTSAQLLHTQQQLLRFETDCAALTRERDAATLERDALATAKRSLELELRRLLDERDAATATHTQLVRPHESTPDVALATTLEHEQREASCLRHALAAARSELTALTHAHERAQSAQSTLQSKLVDQMRLCDASATRVEALQHERDELARTVQVLQHEHADASDHADELHARLVDVQHQLEAVEAQRVELADDLERKSQQLSDLVNGMQSILTNPDTTDNSSSRSVVARLLGLPTTASAAQPLALLQQARVKQRAVERHRDELVLEASRTEQVLQRLRHDADALAHANAALQDELATLRSATDAATRQAREQQSAAASEQTALQQQASAAISELTQQLQTLTARCDAERMEKLQLQAALDALEAAARARLEAHQADQAALTQFKQQLARGITITKHGTRGSPHTRVLFADITCRWLSWKAPSSSLSLTSPRADAKVETRDLVDVLAGATTEVFQRSSVRKSSDANVTSASATRCLSLVFVHPCRTLDLEAASLEQRALLLRGFRLVLDDVRHTQQQQQRE